MPVTLATAAPGSSIPLSQYHRMRRTVPPCQYHNSRNTILVSQYQKARSTQTSSPCSMPSLSLSQHHTWHSTNQTSTLSAPGNTQHTPCEPNQTADYIHNTLAASTSLSRCTRTCQRRVAGHHHTLHPAARKLRDMLQTIRLRLISKRQQSQERKPAFRILPRDRFHLAGADLSASKRDDVAAFAGVAFHRIAPHLRIFCAGPSRAPRDHSFERALLGPLSCQSWVVDHTQVLNNESHRVRVASSPR